VAGPVDWGYEQKLWLAFPRLGSLTAAVEPAVSRVPGRESVRATTLANGLKIIVCRSTISRTSRSTTGCAPAAARGAGDHGLAHFFEHMMFNGTTRRQPGEFDRLMEAQGVPTTRLPATT